MKLNIIVVFNQDKNKILMCKRLKDPYKDLYNFVGGKVEEDENELAAAYRELYEETNINRDDIILTKLMEFHYPLYDEIIEIYVGVLNKEKEVIASENPLLWMDLNHNFFDSNKFAGEGNIGHILEQINLNKDKLFK